MTSLLLLACLQSSPTTCEEHRLHFSGNVVQCSLFAQQVIAPWIASPPKRRVRRFRCGDEVRA